MSTNFPMVYYTGIERGPMHMYFTPDTDASFDAFDLVFFDVADQTIDECGADPALILGKAAAPNTLSWLYNGQVPVEIITPEVEYGMCVTGTLTAANQGIAYGIVKNASGNWAVDLSETSATRVWISRVDVDRGIAFVKFLAASLQGDGIAS
jgi:hypothetical protein